MRMILTLILAATLIGCRADQASKASSELDARATDSTASKSDHAPGSFNPASDTRPLLVCFGDSLTAGYGAEHPYTDYLQADLDQLGYRYRVVNQGVSGDTTKDGLERLSGVLALHPAVVIVEFGGNDGLRGFKTQTTHDNLSHIIAALQAAGARVVLAGITLPPDYGPDYIRAFDANYTALAKQYKLPLLPFLLVNVYGVPGMMQADKIHATDKGNEIVARNLLPILTPVLRKD